MQEHQIQSYISLIHHELLQDEIFSFNKSAVADYPDCTTTRNGNRNRYPSGIFLSQIDLSNGNGENPYTYPKAEFVKWLISRNKLSNQTNKASSFRGVVETISHPIQWGGNSLLTKHEKIKMKPNPVFADFSQNLTPCDCTKQQASLYETTIFPVKVGNYSQSEWGNIVQNIRQKSYKSYEPEQKTILPTLAVIGYPVAVVAKSTTSRGKLNDETLANDSTPLHRAFFVRSLRTPKENAFLKNKERSFLSMVGRIGQRLGVGCVPKFAVFHPDTSYRQAWKLAVARKSNFGAIPMLFKFLVLGEKRLNIFIRANSEAEARQKIQFTSPVLCVARFRTGGVYA